MIRSSTALLLVLALASCRSYHYDSHISDTEGLIPDEQFARYGREQAEAVAISREFAKARQGRSPEALRSQADSAVAYAKKQPDVVDAVAEPLSQRVTVVFKSGWRVGVVPLAD